jgi:hypothetical protein
MTRADRRPAGRRTQDAQPPKTLRESIQVVVMDLGMGAQGD